MKLEDMDYVIRPLTAGDEPILWEMLYQALRTAKDETASLPRDIVQRPEWAHHVEGWGRAGDTGFVAHNPEGVLLGAVWVRLATTAQKEARPGVGPTPELAFAVKPEHRGRGIGSALLTHLVKSNPDQSVISLRVATHKPVLRLYERFGFRVTEQTADAVIMRRET